MLKWSERRPPWSYKSPEGLGDPPTGPRTVYDATAADGARLEAWRWGSPIAGSPFMLEVRRFGAVLIPGGQILGDVDQAEQLQLEPLPVDLGELQSAVDELLPPGTLVVLVLRSNGEDATYPTPLEFHAIRVTQPVIPTGPGVSSSRLVQ